MTTTTPKVVSALASQQHCPTCASHHVLTTVSSNGQRMGAFWCGSCGAFFDTPAGARASPG